MNKNIKINDNLLRNKSNIVSNDTCIEDSNLNDMLDKVYQYINRNDIDIEDLKEKYRNERDKVLSEINLYTIEGKTYGY